MADYTLRSKMSDIQWTSASKLIAEPAAGTHDAVRLPARCFVKSVRIVKSVAFPADGEITVGFSGNGETADPDAFLVSTVADPDALGSVSSEMGAALNAGGKYFSRKGCITVTTVTGTGTAGTFQVFVDYVQLKN